MKKPLFICIVAAILLSGCASGVPQNSGAANADSNASAVSDAQSESAVPTDASAGTSTLPDESQSEISGSADASSGSAAPSVKSQSASSASGIKITAGSAAPSTANGDNFDSLSNTKKCWGQGYNVNDRNQPVSCVEYNDRYGKLGGVFLDSKENNICLTFDEGYENGYTSSILDTLKAKNVKAVFFVTYDYVKKNPDLIRRMIDEGHVIGNHSWSHPSMPTLTAEKAKSEISKLHEYVETNFGYEMTLFRPPMGEFSERTLAIASSLGYKSVFWSFAYKDYDVNNQPDPQAAYDRITKAAHSGGIFLIHAVSKTNAEILGSVIDSFTEQGYTLDVM